MQATYLKNQLLIATPSMQDPRFTRAVIYLCEHTQESAIGLVLNKPTEYQLDFIFEHMNITVTDDACCDAPVLCGGPIEPERGFVVHSPCGEWRSNLTVSEDIAVTTSNDILEAIALGNPPEQWFIALGYAGWDAGQLEDEIKANAWLTAPITKDILFTLPFAERWDAALKVLGISASSLISTGDGNA